MIEAGTYRRESPLRPPGDGRLQGLGSPPRAGNLYFANFTTSEKTYTTHHIPTVSFGSYATAVRVIHCASLPRKERLFRSTAKQTQANPHGEGPRRPAIDQPRRRRPKSTGYVTSIALCAAPSRISQYTLAFVKCRDVLAGKP